MAMWSTAGAIIALEQKKKMLLNGMIASSQSLPRGRIDWGKACVKFHSGPKEDKMKFMKY